MPTTAACTCRTINFRLCLSLFIALVIPRPTAGHRWSVEDDFYMSDDAYGRYYPEPVQQPYVHQFHFPHPWTRDGDSYEVGTLAATCGPAPIVDNAVIDEASFDGNKNSVVGDSVWYHCALGWTMVGNGSIHCRGDGHWGPRLPRCVRPYHAPVLGPVSVRNGDQCSSERAAPIIDSHECIFEEIRWRFDPVFKRCHAFIDCLVVDPYSATSGNSPRRNSFATKAECSKTCDDAVAVSKPSYPPPSQRRTTVAQRRTRRPTTARKRTSPKVIVGVSYTPRPRTKRTTFTTTTTTTLKPTTTVAPTTTAPKTTALKTTRVLSTVTKLLEPATALSPRKRSSVGVPALWTRHLAATTPLKRKPSRRPVRRQTSQPDSSTLKASTRRTTDESELSFLANVKPQPIPQHGHSGYNSFFLSSPDHQARPESNGQVITLRSTTPQVFSLEPFEHLGHTHLALSGGRRGPQCLPGVVIVKQHSSCLNDSLHLVDTVPFPIVEPLKLHYLWRDVARKADGDGEATNDPILVWNEDLAVTAERHASQCLEGHDEVTQRTVPSLSLDEEAGIGQNICWASWDESIKECVAEWALQQRQSDRPDMDTSDLEQAFDAINDTSLFTKLPEPPQPSDSTPESEKLYIGCGKAHCQPASGEWDFIIVCNYGPNRNNFFVQYAQSEDVTSEADLVDMEWDLSEDLKPIN